MGAIRFTARLQLRRARACPPCIMAGVTGVRSHPRFGESWYPQMGAARRLSKSGRDAGLNRTVPEIPAFLARAMGHGTRV